MNAFWISPPKWLAILFHVGLFFWCVSQSGTAAEADAILSVRVIAKADDTGAAQPITPGQVKQAMAGVGKRLKAMGVKGSTMKEDGSEGFLVHLSGLDGDELEKIRATLEKGTKLELREVNGRSEEIGAEGKTLAQRVMDGTDIVPGSLAYLLTVKSEDGEETNKPILLHRRVAIGGSDIAMAVPAPQQADAVAVTLNKAGTVKMINLTINMRPQQDRIAIMLDGKVISAPVLNQVPLGKNFIIEGLGGHGEVQSIAHALNNPLENSIVVERVDASTTTKPSR